MNGSPAAHGLTVAGPLDAFARRKRRALNLASKLRQALRSYQEFETLFTEPLTALQEEAKRADRDLILAAIKDGAWTIKDLHIETSFTSFKLRPILQELLAEKLIVTGTRETSDALGGPPETIYRPR